MQSGELVSDGRPEQDTTLNHAWTRALSLHALDEWQLRPNLFLSAGSRFEAIEGALTDHLGKVRGENQQLIALPGLGLFYQRSRALGLLIGIHRGFSPVAPGQSKEIDPEESINLEAGLRFRVPQREFELIGFANLYSNMLGQCTQSKGCPNDLLDAQFNGGAVDVYGAEVSGKVLESAAFAGSSKAPTHSPPAPFEPRSVRHQAYSATWKLVTRSRMSRRTKPRSACGSVLSR